VTMRRVQRKRKSTVKWLQLRHEMKWNAWVMTNEYSLPQVPYFCIMCLCYISCFIIMESIMLLKNMVFPFFFFVVGDLGCVKIHHFVFCCCEVVDTKNETWWHAILNVIQKPVLLNLYELSFVFILIHIHTS